jgi:hypothetical protein
LTQLRVCRDGTAFPPPYVRATGDPPDDPKGAEMNRSVTMGIAATVVVGVVALAFGTSLSSGRSSLRTELVEPKRQLEHGASVAGKTLRSKLARAVAEVSQRRREPVETVQVRRPSGACLGLALAGSAATR